MSPGLFDDEPTLTLELGVAPYETRPQTWAAHLTVAWGWREYLAQPRRRYLGSCDHHHKSKAEARVCARVAAARLAEIPRVEVK